LYVFLAVGNEPALRAALSAADGRPIAFLAVDFDPLAKGYVAIMWSLSRLHTNKADAQHLGLLRPRRQRPRRRRAAEQRDERAACQLIELHDCPRNRL
jgi:hypothetical protein